MKIESLHVRKTIAELRILYLFALGAHLHLKTLQLHRPHRLYPEEKHPLLQKRKVRVIKFNRLKEGFSINLDRLVIFQFLVPLLTVCQMLEALIFLTPRLLT